MKKRLDVMLFEKGIVSSRSQSESFIKLGKIKVNGQIIKKSGYFVSENSEITIDAKFQYVSRAGLKIESVADIFKLNFKDKVVLDVGSSTGGFTEFALINGAKKVIAVDVGTDQMHPKLRDNKLIELYEKTDIRDVYAIEPDVDKLPSILYHIIDDMPDIILIDVSFISLRQILPHISNYLSSKNTQIVAMVKPQFEAGISQTNKGVIKNDAVRRQILKDFEEWSKQYFVINAKRDSDVAGAKGNQERFYILINKN